MYLVQKYVCTTPNHKLGVNDYGSKYTDNLSSSYIANTVPFLDLTYTGPKDRRVEEDRANIVVSTCSLS
jgi:hypothetical protein